MEASNAAKLGRGAQKIAAFTLAGALALAGTPASAYAATDGVDKDQVVYVRLDPSGEQRGVYVVNQFEADEDAVVTDEGDYREVTNLTDSQELQAHGASTFQVEAGQPFLYQGNLDPQVTLPWTVDVSYRLDGKPISAEDLAGACGELEMTLSIESDGSHAGGYADNYLLQATGALDNELASQIQASGAIEAQASGATQLTYMVLPGSDARFTVTANVRDFEFDGWQIVGVLLSIVLDLDDEVADASDQLSKVETVAAEVNAATAKLSQGSEDLEAGIGQAAEASQEIDALMARYADEGTALIEGTAAYEAQLAEQATALKQQAAATDADAAEAAYEQANQAFLNAYTQAYTTALAGSIAQEPEGSPTQEQIAAASQQAAAEALQTCAAERAALQSALEELVLAQAGAAGCSAAATALEEAANGHFALSQGISEYVQAADSLSQGVSDLSTGITELSGGAETLSSGALSLLAGTGEFAAETAGIGDKVTDEVKQELEKRLNPDFTPVDFVNGSADGIESVQFVYMTDPIEIPEAGETEAPSEAEPGFWKKFLSLFGLD